MVPVTFPSAGDALAGDLYLPPPTMITRRPAVVVAGAWATVKEQMAAGYAHEMATRGLVALTFDFRTWGQSGGPQRSMEDPHAKTADIVTAARFLARHQLVDEDRIFGLGICAGSSYMAGAATLTPLLKSIALIAPALPSTATVLENIGGEAAMAVLIRSSQQAQRDYERDGRLTLAPAVVPDRESTGAGDYYTDPARGLIPEWDNTFNIASWARWADFDAHAAAASIDQPLLVVHSDSAVSPHSVREFVAEVPHAVTQIWLEDVTQYDFYDQPGPMCIAADAATRHFLGTP